MVPKVGGKEGQMEECDLVEEFFHRIRDPLDDDEEEGDFTEDGEEVGMRY